jgi:hypothetical protein
MVCSGLFWPVYESALKQRRPWMAEAKPSREQAEAIAAEMKISATKEGLGHTIPENIVDILMGNLSGSAPGGYLQSILDDLSRRVKTALEQTGVTLEFNVSVLQAPEGAFNAVAVSTPGGVLILINTGLMMLVHQFVKILTYAMRFTEYDKDGKVTIVGDPDRPAGYSQEEIVDALTEVMVAYVCFEAQEGSRRARRFPAQADRRGFIARHLVENVELFVVAHEYGHAIDGHLNKPREGLNQEKKWNQEFMADRLGVNLMLRQFEVIADDLKDDFARQWELLTIAAAPLFCFALDDLIEAARTLVRKAPSATSLDHPPSSERAAYVRQYLRDYTGRDVIFEFAHPLLSLMSFMSNAVIARLRERKVNC